ncbi:MAG: hypothetical protein HOM11_10110 [Methylococcales bacterium]|jgi:hypothetical protein|nr:hypothetical protein [Methylococcales bacterium]MBT7443015.1 hypothetical protein [Methylococcales bacterium]
MQPMILDFSNTTHLINACSDLVTTLAADQTLNADTIDSIHEFSNIIKHTETATLAPDDIHDIGDTGAQLLRHLFFAIQQTDKLPLFNDIAIAFAYWVARHNGTLHQIDFTVNAIAQAANTFHDKVRLESLYEAVTFIIRAVDHNLQDTLDQGAKSPWQLLNLNYGIIATRTHTPELMDSAFSLLLQNIPNDAPGFFQQGMGEMIRLNYPEHVQTVMQRYYNQYCHNQ